ncbi:DUF4238 domain-containing protein [Micrococcus antarcticus]|uniref:DUF4238 domain-containing protein n=1 Tax=Micrococcus antarcticus TaxID=86171 RepID=UPI00384D7CCF
MGEQKKVTHRNHFVAQGYLKNFATDDKRIYEIPFDKTKRAGIKHIRNTAKETDLYTLENTAIFDRIDIAEEMLNVVEQAAHPLLRRLCEGKCRLNPQERGTLSHYFALQLTRGPEVQARYKHFLAFLDDQKTTVSSLDDVNRIAKHYREGRFPYFDAATVWKNMNDENYTFSEVIMLDHLRNIFISAEDIYPYLLGRPWEFIYFRDYSLFTSDSPVSPFAVSREKAAQRFVVEDADGVIVPIGRKLAIRMGRSPKTPQGLSPLAAAMHKMFVERAISGELDSRSLGTPEDADVFNKMTLDTAFRYIYRHPDDAHLNPEKLPNQSLLK